ncbi:MAG: SDR family NAD(P)-dependent oxidoreductase, partial [Pseudomonadales bacterium]
MNPYTDLDGKVALVTGANGGMGNAIAEALVDCGATVVASDIQDSRQSPWASHRTAHYVQADVASEPAVADMVQQALQHHSRLDIAVNAAAVEFELAKLADCSVTDFDRLMAVNLRGLFLCLKYELKAMADNTGCAIVNLASTTSSRPGR